MGLFKKKQKYAAFLMHYKGYSKWFGKDEEVCSPKTRSLFEESLRLIIKNQKVDAPLASADSIIVLPKQFYNEIIYDDVKDFHDIPVEALMAAGEFLTGTKTINIPPGTGISADERQRIVIYFFPIK